MYDAVVHVRPIDMNPRNLLGSCKFSLFNSQSCVSINNRGITRTNTGIGVLNGNYFKRLEKLPQRTTEWLDYRVTVQL